MFLYNQLIDLRHEVSIVGKSVNQSEVENAELKNNFYQAFNEKNLESLAEKNSLVLEKKPEYVRLNTGESLTANY